MPQFDNVSIVKKANVYDHGKVVSRTVLFADGSRKTLGFMQPGEYSFDTAEAEIMEILGGELEVLLPGDETWQSIRGGESFRIPAHSRFSMRVIAPSDYCCSYLK